MREKNGNAVLFKVSKKEKGRKSHFSVQGVFSSLFSECLLAILLVIISFDFIFTGK